MVSTITSVQNERVKYVRSLARRRIRQRDGRFVLEGTRLIEEVARAGIRPAFLLYTEAWATTSIAQRLLTLLPAAEMGTWLVSDAVLASCADTKNPQGVVAVVPFVRVEPRQGLILILDRLRNPGNLGAILRSATASGVGQVILSPGTIDPYNPKVVRGAMGAHFRLPVTVLGWPAIAERVSSRAVWLAETSGDVAYHEVDWTSAAALIVGGEAAGASEQAYAVSTGRIRIPMSDETESLNAAMAATVILFEAARQQRTRFERGPWLAL